MRRYRRILVGGGALTAVVVAAIGIPAAAASAPSGSGWQVTTFRPASEPTAVSIDQIAASGRANAWALGSEFSPPATGSSFVARSSGSQWRKVSLPPGARRTSLDFVGTTSASDTWLLSSTDSFHWDGRKWTTRTLASAGRGPNVWTGAILSPTDAWAFGGCCGTRPTEPYAARFTGQSWKLVKLPSALVRPGYIIARASAISAHDIFALMAKIATTAPKLPAELIRWNGHRWSRVGFTPGPKNQPLWMVATSPSSVWIVTGKNGAELEHWDGHAWTSVSIPLTSGNVIVTVYGIALDGHGGVEVVGTQGPSTTNEIWDFRNGHWRSPIAISPDFATLSGVTPVPGTSAIDVNGQAPGPTVLEPFGLIARYQP